MWEIVPQETKKGFVDIKQVQYYPIKSKRTKEVVGFGRLGMSCLRVYFRDPRIKDYEQYMVTCIMRTPFGENTKTRVPFWNITCPDRMVAKSMWDKELVRIPGRAFGGKATSGSMGRETFLRELGKIVGEEFALTVISSFETVLTKVA